jgi:lipoate---protein ligase
VFGEGINGNADWEVMPGPLESAQSLAGMEMLVQDDAGLGGQAANLALEEALIRAVPPGPLLRIWQNGRCVVIGRGQQVSREVNVAACAASGVPVLRRASGGGTVYHDLGNLNITVAVPGRRPGLAGELAALVAGAIERLGLRPVIGERGVFIGQAKVSGLASQVTRDGTLAHATLLVTTPAGQVNAYLAPAPPDRRPLDSRRSLVLPLCAHNPALDIAAGRRAVLAEAASRYGPLSRRPPRPAERRWQDRLLAERYRDDAWHRTVRPKEASWTTRPVLISTG